MLSIPVAGRHIIMQLNLMTMTIKTIPRRLNCLNKSENEGVIVNFARHMQNYSGENFEAFNSASIILFSLGIE